jgi:hypothetical protein
LERRAGRGNYTEERDQLVGDMTVEEMAAEIKIACKHNHK